MNSVVTTYPDVLPDALPEATSISLSLPESMTFEQWEEVGAELANRARKLNWWIGDWWAAGHHRYGERARLAARGLFGKEFKTLANIASVCRAFEPSRRREGLSWSHHAEAAALSPNAADMLLDLAERDRLSKAQVRAAVITIRGGPPVRMTNEIAAVSALIRAYNRLPGEVRVLVAQAIGAANGAELDPATGQPKTDSPPATLPDRATEHETEPAMKMEAPETGFDTALDLTLNLTPDLEAIQAEADTVLDLALEFEPLPPDEDAAPFELEPAMEQPAPEAEMEQAKQPSAERAKP